MLFGPRKEINTRAQLYKRVLPSPLCQGKTRTPAVLRVSRRRRRSWRSLPRRSRVLPRCTLAGVPATQKVLVVGSVWVLTAVLKDAGYVSSSSALVKFLVCDLE
ncbi:hypothetical protein AOLI_G00147160 [Acnodon oligacanthus]